MTETGFPHISPVISSVNGGTETEEGSVTLAADLGMRAYVPERASPKQRRWVDKDPKEKHAVYMARRRTKSERGKQRCRLRSELTERSFAHVCDTGGARRT